MDWFLEHRPDLSRLISYCCLLDKGKGRCQRLLAIPTREQLVRVLRYVLDEQEFLFGNPVVLGQACGEQIRIAAGKGRLILGNHPLHPVATDDLEVGQMADDLQSGPLAGKGAGHELLLGQPGHGLLQ